MTNLSEYKYWFINCSKYTTPRKMLVIGKAVCGGGGKGICGVSLYFHLNFSVNLKLLLKSLLILKIICRYIGIVGASGSSE